MITIQPDTLTDFIHDMFRAAGASEDDAALVTRSLVTTNLAGHDSHGVMRVMQYVAMIRRGEIDVDAAPRVAQETAVLALVDADRSFGQAAARFAMQTCIDKAREQGLAAVGLTNCNHVGRLGEWVEMAAREGMVGLAFCNAGSKGGLVAPFGGASRRLGTNPIACAFPLQDREPFVMDFATSAVAEGKVRIAHNAGKSLPDGWILDRDGQPSTDPDALYADGMLRTAADHKGYALSLMMELLAGALTGRGCTPFDDIGPGNGVLFIVLQGDAFRPLAEVLHDSARLADEVKTADVAPGAEEILVPGEPEQRAAATRRAQGIPIDEGTWGQLVELAGELGVEVPARTV